MAKNKTIRKITRRLGVTLLWISLSQWSNADTSCRLTLGAEREGNGIFKTVTGDVEQVKNVEGKSYHHVVPFNALKPAWEIIFAKANLTNQSQDPNKTEVRKLLHLIAKRLRIAGSKDGLYDRPDHGVSEQQTLVQTVANMFQNIADNGTYKLHGESYNVDGTGDACPDAGLPNGGWQGVIKYPPWGGFKGPEPKKVRAADPDASLDVGLYGIMHNGVSDEENYKKYVEGAFELCDLNKNATNELPLIKAWQKYVGFKNVNNALIFNPSRWVAANADTNNEFVCIPYTVAFKWGGKAVAKDQDYPGCGVLVHENCPVN